MKILERIFSPALRVSSPGPEMMMIDRVRLYSTKPAPSHSQQHTMKQGGNHHFMSVVKVYCQERQLLQEPLRLDTFALLCQTIMDSCPEVQVRWKDSIDSRICDGTTSIISHVLEGAVHKDAEAAKEKIKRMDFSAASTSESRSMHGSQKDNAAEDEAEEDDKGHKEKKQDEEEDEDGNATQNAAALIFF